MPTKIRVLIADDHAIVREGLRAILTLEGDMDLVGEAADGVQAVDLARKLHPDVIIMDLLMPGKDGIEATNEILSFDPSIRILVLTSFTDSDKVLPAIQAGALGYFIKNSPPPELLQAVREVSRGAAVLHPAVSRHLLSGLNRSAERESLSETTLTQREIEILKLVARGYSNDEIADNLVISNRTVGVHISHLLDKLHLNNRTQAALYALRKGLVGLFEEK